MMKPFSPARFVWHELGFKEAARGLLQDHQFFVHPAGTIFAHDQFDWFPALPTWRARNAVFSTLPVLLRGSASTKTMCFGFL
jgi:hypothetical protein